MARRHSGSRNRSRSRVASVSRHNAPEWATRPRVAVVNLSRGPSRVPRRLALGLIEDRRRWNPQTLADPVVRSSRSSSSTRPRLVQHAGRHGRLMRVSFKNPAHVIICIRRALRRRVMFAGHGAGRRKMRRPRRGPFSNVRC